MGWREVAPGGVATCLGSELCRPPGAGRLPLHPRGEGGHRGTRSSQGDCSAGHEPVTVTVRACRDRQSWRRPHPPPHLAQSAVVRGRAAAAGMLASRALRADFFKLAEPVRCARGRHPRERQSPPAPRSRLPPPRPLPPSMGSTRVPVPAWAARARRVLRGAPGRAHIRRALTHRPLPPCRPPPTQVRNMGALGKWLTDQPNTVEVTRVSGAAAAARAPHRVAYGRARRAPGSAKRRGSPAPSPARPPPPRARCRRPSRRRPSRRTTRSRRTRSSWRACTRVWA